MNTTSTENFEDKENGILGQKRRSSQCFQRSFGTDLTKTMINPIIPQQKVNAQEYIDEIFTNLLASERRFLPKPGFLKKQADLSEKLRAVLIDWLVEVHHRFKLEGETLYLTINLIDRYLEKTPVSQNRFQLVGISALLIASKYEDIYPPEVNDLVYISGKTFNKQDILQMESSILKQLNYNITIPSAFRFLERFSRIACFTKEQFMLARYFIELSLVEYKMLCFSNSLIAAASVYMVKKINNIKPEWGEELCKASTYQESKIRLCAKEMCILFQKAPGAPLQGVRKKFLSKDYCCIANTSLV